MQIYIIRHGETYSNAEGRFQGWLNDKLNPMGEKLAVDTGKVLGEQGVKFDAAFSSDLIGAKRTAELVLEYSGNRDTPLFMDKRIREISIGAFEGKRVRDLYEENDAEIVDKFLKDPVNDLPFPGGESVRDVMKRTQEFLFELAAEHNKYNCVLIATHGCALRAMLNFLYEDREDYWHGRVPLNCCVNILEADEKGIRLVAEDLILYDKSLMVDRYKLE